MSTPPQKAEPISILKAPPPPRSSIAIPSSSAIHTAPIVMSEDEDDEDPKYAVSDGDGEDEDAGYIPSGKTLELLQTEKACYSGYLLKKGEKRRTWKKRWFVLRTTKLAMYKDKKEYKLLRIIDLHDIHSVVQVTSKNKYRYVFAIITPKRMYYVQADDQHAMEGWFDAIDQAKEELRLHDADDDSSSVGRDQEFAKDVVTSYKSASSMTQHQPRRRSSGTATTTLDTATNRRQSAGGMVASPSIASSSPSSSVSFSQSPPTNHHHHHHHLSSSPPPPVPPLPASIATASTLENGTKSSTVSPSPMDMPTSATSLQPPPPLASPLSDYTTGHVYPLSPTLEQAQVHFAEGIASSEDDEEYSVNNSVIDVRKEENRNRVLVEGYLLKLGRNKGWQKRWFVLRTDTLAYYENEKEYSPHRIIPLEHIIDTLEIEAISKNKQHCFKIIIPKRNYVLCASTENDLEAWLNAFSVAIRRTKKDSTTKSTAATESTSSPLTKDPPPSSSLSGNDNNNNNNGALLSKQQQQPLGHQPLRLDNDLLDRCQGLPHLTRKSSMDSFENSSHISGVSGAGGVGGAGGALGRH
ncbi:hypothetical protein BCR42DRAFT_405055 [Absidia repens]|uniref:PH domain-containing protein n=1 Tax=Absidia repens TaxID=90262 RepID=A0A1X2IX21_9FUNG|nr:hypothetical protein BCR42DRAFT_405055 [Absidia repens]